MIAPLPLAVTCPCIQILLIYGFTCKPLWPAVFVVFSVRLQSGNVYLIMTEEHTSFQMWHFAQLLKHVLFLTEIYERYLGGQLYAVTADGSHGQYTLV